MNPKILRESANACVKCLILNYAIMVALPET
jgi:hypothetical protein